MSSVVLTDVLGVLDVDRSDGNGARGDDAASPSLRLVTASLHPTDTHAAVHRDSC